MIKINLIDLYNEEYEGKYFCFLIIDINYVQKFFDQWIIIKYIIIKKFSNFSIQLILKIFRIMGFADWYIFYININYFILLDKYGAKSWRHF